MKFFEGFDKAYLWLVFPVLRFVWPVLQYRVRPILVAPFILMWFLSICLHKKRPCFKSLGLSRLLWVMIIALAVYVILPLVYGHFDPQDRLSFRPYGVISRMTEFAVMISVVHYSLIMGKLREMKFITGLVLFANLWMAFAALRGGEDVAAYGGARIIASISGTAGNDIENVHLAMDAVKAGMGTSESTYISAFLIPMFLNSILEVRGWMKKSVCIVMLVCSYLNIKYGGLNTPYLIACVGIFLLCVARGVRRGAAVIVCGLLVAIMMLIFCYNQRMFSFAATPLRAMAEMTEKLPQLSGRLLSVAESVEGSGTTYATIRYELQQKSVRCFLRGSVVLGAIGDTKADAGGHSELLDCLAYFGLVGFGVVLVFWCAYLKYSMCMTRMLGRKWLLMPYVYVGTWIFAAIPNPVVMGSPIVIFMLPALALYYKEFEKKWSV